MFACSCLCDYLFICVWYLCRLEPEPDCTKREGQWNQSTPKLPHFPSSQPFSLRLDRSHKTIYVCVSEHWGKHWNMVFSLEMRGDTAHKPPWHKSSTPSASCATMSANCRTWSHGWGHSWKRNGKTQSDEAVGSLFLFNVSQPVEGIQAEMVCETVTSTGRLRIKGQKQQHLTWNRISEVACELSRHDNNTLKPAFNWCCLHLSVVSPSTPSAYSI